MHFKVRRPSVPSVGTHSLVLEACAYSVQACHHFHSMIKNTPSYYNLPNRKSVASSSPVIPDGSIAESFPYADHVPSPCSWGWQALHLSFTPIPLHPSTVPCQVTAHQRLPYFSISRRTDMNFMYVFNIYFLIFIYWLGKFISEWSQT